MAIGPTDVDRPVIFRPRAAAWTAGALGVALAVAAVVGWWALPAATRALMGPAQVITLVIMLLGVLLGLAAIVVSSVRADQHGVRVRNGLRARAWRWEQISGIRLADGDPWVTLLVRDPDDPQAEPRRQMVFAVQPVDGEHARQAFAELRVRHASHASGPELRSELG